MKFEIMPRFPIFGQWKTDWNQGYNMPTQEHLYQHKKNSEKFTLEVDFMHSYYDSLTETYKVRVILPEGAENIEIEFPDMCGVKEEDIKMSKYFGTLDYFGRPTIEITKKNAVFSLCYQTLKVHYTFGATQIYQEPL